MPNYTCRYCGAPSDDRNHLCHACFMAECGDDRVTCEINGCPVLGWAVGDADEVPVRWLCPKHAAEEGFCFFCGDHVGAENLTPTDIGRIDEKCFWAAERPQGKAGVR